MTEFSDRPIFVVDYKTTGADLGKHKIISLNILKCRIFDHRLHPIECYSFSREEPTLDCTSQLTSLMTELKEFLGEKATICGFNTKPVFAPVILNAMQRTGISLDIFGMFDLFTLAKTVMPPIRLPDGKYGYTAETLASVLGFDNSVQGYVEIFNTLYNKVPFGLCGVESGFIKKTGYIDKKREPERILFTTKAGTVAFNCNNLYFEECMPGYFDVIDMDSFTDFVLKKTKSNDLNEFAIKLKQITK